MKQIAVIIGAGRIGGAIAEHLADRFAVDLIGHRELELTSPERVREFFECYDSIDLLVNAAGSYCEIGNVRSVSPVAWRWAIEVNLLGVYASCHYAMRRMPVGAHIINIAGGGKGPLQGRSGYAAAKSGLWRFTETLAAEEPKLRVNAIAPGPMWSRMQEAAAGVCEPWADFVRELKGGRGEVPVANTLRAVDHILATRPTGRLLFARNFQTRLAIAASK